MRDQYWYMWAEIYRRERYFHHYQSYSRVLNSLVIAVCSIASAASIASWGIWGVIPLFWSILTAFSQVFQAINPVLPFSKQLVALRFLLPDLSKLLIVIEGGCHRIQVSGLDDDAILVMYQEYLLQADEIENRYIGNSWFPVITRIAAKSEVERDLYFQQRSTP